MTEVKSTAVLSAWNEPFQITLVTGASLGKDLDRVLTEAHILKKRLPLQSDRTLRTAINRGEVMRGQVAALLA